ncbi:MAG: hypothetical protein Q7S05_02165 [bacterium]|nr:hypothetical protein [bacterium]
MERLKLLGGFLNGLLLKALPFLGYKGVVNQQIRIYKKFKRANLEELKRFQTGNQHSAFIPSYAESDILNILLDSRRKFSSSDVGADAYYQDLMKEPNKSLESVIMAIVEWEYLSNMRAYRIRGENEIPSEFIESYRQEMKDYIREKVSSA